jgi:hypothetical protein
LVNYEPCTAVSLFLLLEIGLLFEKSHYPLNTILKDFYYIMDASHVKIRTGIPGFDSILSGGFKEGRTVVLSGPPVVERQLLVYSFCILAQKILMSLECL